MSLCADKMPDSFWEWLSKCPVDYYALSSGSYTTLHYAFRVPKEGASDDGSDNTRL